MIPMSIKFQDDDKVPAWPDLKDGKFTHTTAPIDVVVLRSGMQSGQPSIGMRIELPDGTSVIAETSARLFCSLARMVMAKYPDLFEGD